MTLEKAALPTLPESVDAWLSKSIDEGAGAAHLSRRSGSRWQRHATWHAERHGDVVEWVVDQATRYVSERGRTDFRLERKDADAIEWTGEIADPLTVDDVLAPQRSQHVDTLLANGLVSIILRLAGEVRETCRVMPELLKQYGDSIAQVVKAQRETATESEGVAIAAIKTDAQMQKMDRLLMLGEKLLGSGDDKPRKAIPANADNGKTITAPDLLRVLTPDDRALVLSSPLGQALAIADDLVELKKAADAIWAAHNAGTLRLSAESLLAARRLLGFA